MTQYQLVNKIYNDNLTLIDQLIGKSKFPLAFQVLKNFALKIEDLKLGLESTDKGKAFYSSQSLSRVLSEHFLIAFYIFTKCRVEKNDDCASEYLDYYPLYELIKRENYNSKLYKTFDSKKTPLENFFISVPDFRGQIEETDILEINKKANQFDVRNILKYVQNKIATDTAIELLYDVVLNDCRKYNGTSSYIHGGRLAEIEFLETSLKDKNKIISDNTKMGEIYAKHSLSFVMLLLLVENNDFVLIYKPIIDSFQVSSPS